MRNFLEKYTKQSTSDESTLRKNYLKKVYENKIEEIRMNLRNEKIWISIDETTDLRKNAIGHVIVASLKKAHSKC